MSAAISALLRPGRTAVGRCNIKMESGISWYPGHMEKATHEMAQRLKYIDTVFEVRDARIPFSSINTTLEQMLQKKRRIIIFNKADLADPANEQKITDFYTSNRQLVKFFSASNDTNQDCMNLIRFAINDAPKKKAPTRQIYQTIGGGKNVEEDYRSVHSMMIMGVPNVGKSTIINRMRRASGVTHKNNVKTGALPGVTRHITAFRVSEDPVGYLVDTPGIMLPRINTEDQEKGLNLILTRAIRDSVIVHPQTVAEFLIEKLKTMNALDCLEEWGIDPKVDVHPNDNLLTIAKSQGMMTADGQYNLETASAFIIDKYRKGELGRFTLDDIDMEIKLRT
ncbi:ribosomal biogenesis GTPase [Planoprotostelium fungivorum]|uniref:Mitochondrial GTPase 1 n=1 Tax=Planoprotostelium fungivorum TaxID=1890364 RepID=A0A2P6N2V4_9EUKA|nr:ribosomal biogenesis GTPase [Planoprotostelium fungivorum]